MILSGTSIAKRNIISPHLPRTHVTLESGRTLSYGESFAGYDIRVREEAILSAGHTMLVSSLEEFNMPTNVLGIVHDKSSWARMGLSVQNTVLEPGWKGYLTLELLYSPLFGNGKQIALDAGSPIAQIVFHEIDAYVEGYDGKYQNQPAKPIGAL